MPCRTDYVEVTKQNSQTKCDRMQALTCLVCRRRSSKAAASAAATSTAGSMTQQRRRQRRSRSPLPFAGSSWSQLSSSSCTFEEHFWCRLPTLQSMHTATCTRIVACPNPSRHQLVHDPSDEPFRFTNAENRTSTVDAAVSRMPAAGAASAWCVESPLLGAACIPVTLLLLRWLLDCCCCRSASRSCS